MSKIFLAIAALVVAVAISSCDAPVTPGLTPVLPPRPAPPPAPTKALPAQQGRGPLASPTPTMPPPQPKPTPPPVLGKASSLELEAAGIVAMLTGDKIPYVLGDGSTVSLGVDELHAEYERRVREEGRTPELAKLLKAIWLIPKPRGFLPCDSAWFFLTESLAEFWEGTQDWPKTAVYPKTVLDRTVLVKTSSGVENWSVKQLLQYLVDRCKNSGYRVATDQVRGLVRVTNYGSEGRSDVTVSPAPLLIFAVAGTAVAIAITVAQPELAPATGSAVAAMWVMVAVPESPGGAPLPPKQ
ncbi:MAG: hypothetical protein UX31_C0003G0032 [Candidatus Nomurabacteria bacterium GW2011_GWA1_46_11]|uniref:Uncharacterized protein n=1 Tax=Candidatus Nomurabacteria bacterium GW2011_GWA1_46_11 TaxID=1618732 RepID=A0A0G1NPL2_9BACT|nr:MAG: hypothetical protein UW69_C0026G0009 [Microgenomates group bacterium GW2011_GWA2_44_7]KKT78308.1 MAG: hypothetical protein UW73_C0004G0032 [Microgenomates group bacterium GW2011_GWB1_44_8]KKU22366.1 MAG: hypothetical protein UX31_C0003G0032 [Candidatus Nomurabacteria bacterium GW2011_GWA1_46_11]